MTKSRPKEFQHNGAIGKSKNHTEMDKLEYIERRAMYYLKFGRLVDHADIVRKDFSMTMTDFMTTNMFYDRIRAYLYPRRGKHANNTVVR